MRTAYGNSALVDQKGACAPGRNGTVHREMRSHCENNMLVLGSRARLNARVVVNKVKRMRLTGLVIPGLHRVRRGVQARFAHALFHKCRLPEWFRVVMALDAGLWEFHQTPDEQPQTRREVERPKDVSRQTPVSSPKPRAVFRCFRCNRQGHRVAECPVPVIPSTPTAIGKPGATPRKVMEKSRAARQAGGGPSQQTLGEQTPMLEEYDDGDPAEDPMQVDGSLLGEALPRSLRNRRPNHEQMAQRG
ncbi:major vault protein-like [Crotalus adamanteus]|uniref:Major vault protein-like n=1 Tax=Crotalus adamanteus TaxID=8729 RepID=A0AAW1B098_CROAD